MNKHLIRAAAVATAVGLSLSACSSGNTSSGSDSGAVGEPVSGGDLVMARAEDATSLLPPESSTNADIWMLQQTYETLTTNKVDGTGVEPLLATDWTTSEDGMTWTFNIREGVVFHNGDPLTAEDVKWSLDYSRTASDLNQWSSLYSRISSVDVVDDQTVSITLTAAWPALPDYLALFAASIYPADFAGETPEYMREHTIGTGPFKFDEWTKGQSISLVKNEEYWDADLPYLDSVTFNLVPDDNTRLLQLQGNQIDIHEFPSPASFGTLENTSGIVAEAFESTQTLYINVNTRQPGLDDPKVRRAMSYAVDREAIIASVLSGYGDPANTFLSPGLPGHNDSVEGAVYDMDLAKQTMAESESPDGLSLSIQIPSGTTDRQQIAEILQQNWAELGIDVTIEPADATVVASSRREGTFDVQVGYATSDVVDPSQMIDFLVRTDGSGVNSGYANEEVYALAEQYASSADDAERTDLIGQIQTIVAEEAPIIPIAYQPLLFAYSDELQGFSSAVLGTYVLKTAWLNE